MAHQGSGIVLKTAFDQKNNRVLRTIFDKRCVTYQTITDYVPPLFLVINYEQAAFNRECFYRPAQPELSSATNSDSSKNTLFDKNFAAFTDTTVKTDEIFCDNVKFVESLLVSADCSYDVCQVTFLRLEIAGDFQRSFDKLYPLWNVGIGALVRLSFSAWPTRMKALKVLASNAVNNQDVYTINFSANMSAVTIVDYLEPLFAYCAKKTKSDGHETVFCTRMSGSTNNSAKRTSFATNTTEMFEINFCVIDMPTVGYRNSVINDWGGGSRVNNATSIYSSAEGSATGTGLSKKSAGKRKRGESSSSTTTTTIDTGKQQKLNVDMDEDRQIRPARRDIVVLEKQRTMCGSLSVHDVRPYFAMLQSKRLTRISMDQLEELPVVMIRCECYFSLVTCRVLDRTDNQPTVLHVYYCWDQEVYEFLNAFADTCNNHQRNILTRTMVAVSPLCSEDVEARLNMLRDLKNVIWKDNINSYIRLAISESHDKEMLARYFYEPLVFRVQRTTADLETEIKRSVTTSMASGVRDMFRNAISLDCSRMCDNLDTKKSAFARIYRNLVSGSSFTSNGFIRMDRQSLRGSVASRRNVIRSLEHTQDFYTTLVTEFCSEQILDVSFEMTTELRLGLLDVFGLKYTEQLQEKSGLTNTTTDSNRSGSEELVLDSSRVANMVFMDAMTNMSMYTGTCGTMSSYNDFFAQEKSTTTKPLSQSIRGLYTRDLLEFDLQSAYPTVTTLYNISPETTAIVQREILKKHDETLIPVVVNDASRSQHGFHTTNVMTSFYNQIGHLNETNSNLVIVSLRREIYVGFLPRIMERLVLKRKKQNQLLNTFFKKMANIVYGCNGKASAFNDLFSPQCASAIRSACKGIMMRTLQNIPPEHVVMTQTDGALLYAYHPDLQDHPTCKQLETIVRASLDTIKTDLGNRTATSSLTLEPRVRAVSMCLVIDQNRYLILYKDGEVVSKGRETQPTCGDTRIEETLLSAISTYAINHLNPAAGNTSVELNRFMAFCFKHLNELNVELRPDWFIKLDTPSTYDTLFSVSSQKYLLGLRLDGFSSDECLERLVDTSVVKFGDTVVVWPVILNDTADQVSTEFRVSRPLYNVAVKPNYVFVMKSFLWYWTRWLFTICYADQDEVILKRMYFAICKQYENEMGVLSTTK